MLSRLLAVFAVAFLSACGADHKWATDAQVAQAEYVAGPPASVTLITSINGRSNSGAHSALIINGSQRVLYDPAGSWELQDGLAPERNDLHYGMTPAALASYTDFQAGGVFYVISQTVYVSQAVADQTVAEAVAFGSAPKADCAHAITAILQKVPGFESLPTTYFPKALSRNFAKLAGVAETRIEGTVAAPEDAEVTRAQDFAVDPGVRAATN